MPEKKAIVPVGKIEQRILLIRGEKTRFFSKLVGEETYFFVEYVCPWGKFGVKSFF